MGEKSAQKRKFILETARKVFVEKGFKKVTMKDIVEACEISRGGLYLYFESTGQIFLEVMKLESEETDDVFPTRSRRTPRRRIFLCFSCRSRRRSCCAGRIR